MGTPLAPADIERLGALLRAEILSIPCEHWGQFFPGSVATWRFVHETRPDLLGELSAGFSRAPWFRGRGAEWFTSTLLNEPAVIEALDVLLRSVISQVPVSAWDRGFLVAPEVPHPDPRHVQALLEAILGATPRKNAV